jgi:hypothetical protein
MDAETMVQRWPFEVGRGPFHIKGTAVKGALERLGNTVPGGMRALLDAAGNRPLERLVQSQILPSSMYDCYALALLDHHAARLLGRTLADLVRSSAAAQFNTDLSGIYKVVLRVVSPRLVIDRVARVTSGYFDFSPGTVRKVSDHEAVLVRADFPELLVPWYGPVAEGYLLGALHATGATSVRQAIATVPRGNQAHGLALVDLEMTVSWS